MGKRIFIDCGGHDGCSVIQFLLRRPEYSAITFEPNAAFAKYYRFLPTQLIAKAVSTHDGQVSFTVDPLDGDGSSICFGKDVVFDNSLSNDECPTVDVECVDLSRFIASHIGADDYLCLKLDVEGAEYAILDKMINEGTIDLVRELFIEFHWNKCGVSGEVHDRLVALLEKRTVIKEWDAGQYAVHMRGAKAKLRRGLLLFGIWPRHVGRLLANRFRPLATEPAIVG